MRLEGVAEQFRSERSRFFGGEQIAAGWEDGLRPIESVHHQAGNYRMQVRGDEERGTLS
jgi:hypothetical protein